MIIAGAGGHAMEVLDILIRRGIPKEEILLYDDIHSDKLALHDTFKILKNRDQLTEAIKQNPEFCLGVGNPMARKKLYDLFLGIGGTPIFIRGNFISSNFSTLAQGVDVMDYVYIGSNTHIGLGTLVNTKASVHHEVIINEYCEISPGATLLGGVHLGSYCQVGASAVILPKVKVGNHVIIGAGAVVNKDLPDNVMVAGVPARILKEVDSF